MYKEMAVASIVQTSIVNTALTRLGERPVVDIGESGPATVLYDEVRLAFLERFDWDFATFRQQLNLMSVKPPSDFANMFALPTNPAFVRAIDIQLSIPSLPYRLESYVNPSPPGGITRVLLTSADGVFLAYVGEVDEVYWSPLARMAFSKKLAVEMSTHISGKSRLRGTLLAEAELALADAIRSAQAQDTPRRMEIDARYEIARLAGANFDPDRRDGVTIDDLIV